MELAVVVRIVLGIGKGDEIGEISLETFGENGGNIFTSRMIPKIRNELLFVLFYFQFPSFHKWT